MINSNINIGRYIRNTKYKLIKKVHINNLSKIFCLNISYSLLSYILYITRKYNALFLWWRFEFEN